MRIKFGRRAVAVIAVTGVVGATGVAAVALAAPIRHATYRGTIERASNVIFHISFKVSANGRRVSGFALPNGYPVYCQGGGFGSVQAASGTITARGTFKVKLPIVFAPTHQHQGFVIVTGRFAKHGGESGKVTTAFTKYKICNGTSSYAATG